MPGQQPGAALIGLGQEGPQVQRQFRTLDRLPLLGGSDRPVEQREADSVAAVVGMHAGIQRHPEHRLGRVLDRDHGIAGQPSVPYERDGVPGQLDAGRLQFLGQILDRVVLTGPVGLRTGAQQLHPRLEVALAQRPQFHVLPRFSAELSELSCLGGQLSSDKSAIRG